MIMKYREIQPAMHEDCFVAKNATVIGDVTMKEHASVWFHTVIRGDSDKIEIGRYTNIQDNCTLHTDAGHQIHLGDYITVGHNAIVHGAFIDDETLIGMGAIILNKARIGKHCVIGAGALVCENQIIPDNSVVIGCPAKVLKHVSQEQIDHILENAIHYAELGMEYKKMEEKENG